MVKLLRVEFFGSIKEFVGEMRIARGQKNGLPSGGNVWVGGIRQPPYPPTPPNHHLSICKPPRIEFGSQKKYRNWRRKSWINNAFRFIYLHGYPQILLRRQFIVCVIIAY